MGDTHRNKKGPTEGGENQDQKKKKQKAPRALKRRKSLEQVAADKNRRSYRSSGRSLDEQKFIREHGGMVKITKYEVLSKELDYIRKYKGNKKSLARIENRQLRHQEKREARQAFTKQS